MNDKFFSLPKERQQAILNAGYHVFSQNSYKKSPVSEIAAAAGISKSLLFYYFRNKQELYLFLWENCIHATVRSMNAYDCYSQSSLFEMLERGMKAKMDLMREYPDMGNFAIKAFYEEDPAIAPAIHKSYKAFQNTDAKDALKNLDPSQFKDGLDLKMMYREMYLAAEGYLWEMLRHTPLDSKSIEQDFGRMIQFWKHLYLK